MKVFLFSISLLILHAPFAVAQDARIDEQTLHIRFESAVKLSFHRTGIISEVGVQEGDEVRRGQVLARLDSRVAKAEAAVARERANMRGAIDVAEKAAESAKAECRVIRRANESQSGTYPAIEVERRRIASESSVMEVALRKHELTVAELEARLADEQLRTYQLEAPFDGMITRVDMGAGETADPAKVVIEMVDPSVLIADAYVPFADTRRLQRGTAVELLVTLPADSQGFSGDFAEAGRVESGGAGTDGTETDAAESRAPTTEERRYPGEIRFVDLSVQTLRDVVRVTARIPNRDGDLRAGVTGRLRIGRDIRSDGAGVQPRTSTIPAAAAKLTDDDR